VQKHHEQISWTDNVVGAICTRRRVLIRVTSSFVARFSAAATPTREIGMGIPERSGVLTVSASVDSDETLLARACEGDREALGLLFRRYARIVRGVAYRVLRDASEADDLLQDIFLLIHRKCGMFDASRGPARFWILQMTYHRAIARRRYLNSRHFYTRVDLDDVERDLAAAGSGNLDLHAAGDGLLGNSGLKRLFEALTDDQRQTLRLFFVEGYTLTEIATKLSQTRGNVKHHYFRGLEKLRKQFFDSKLRGDSAV
jgi:RNA polymerase sigma-70 factor (ECF subfamily)